MSIEGSGEGKGKERVDIDEGKEELKEVNPIQQYITNAFLMDVDREWKEKGLMDDKLSIEQCALEILLHCKHKIDNPEGGGKVKVHDPSQVLDYIGIIMKGTPEEQKAEVMEKVVSTFQKVVEFGGLAYQDLNIEGTALNNQFNDLIKDMKKDMGPQKAKMTKIAIEGICDQQAKKAQQAKDSAKAVLENDQGIDVARFTSKSKVSSKQVKKVAKAIAGDLKAFQMSETQLLGSDEYEVSRHAKFFNGISAMVVDSIVQAQSEKEAANALRLYIEVGKQCLKNNDFDSAQAISAALSNTAVERLHNTDALTGLMDKIPKSSRKDHRELQSTFSPLAEGKDKLRTKMDAAANQWHTIPSPVIVGKLAGVDGMDASDADKLEVASKNILPLIAQREKQLAQPVDTKPKTNFVHMIANTPHLDERQSDMRMEELRSKKDGKKVYDGKNFKSRTGPIEGNNKLSFASITDDYVPVMAPPSPPSGPTEDDEALIALDMPADMREYEGPAPAESFIESIDVGPSDFTPPGGPPPEVPPFDITQPLPMPTFGPPPAPPNVPDFKLPLPMPTFGPPPPVPPRPKKGKEKTTELENNPTPKADSGVRQKAPPKMVEELTTRWEGFAKTQSELKTKEFDKEKFIQEHKQKLPEENNPQKPRRGKGK